MDFTETLRAFIELFPPIHESVSVSTCIISNFELASATSTYLCVETLRRTDVLYHSFYDKSLVYTLSHKPYKIYPLSLQNRTHMRT